MREKPKNPAFKSPARTPKYVGSVLREAIRAAGEKSDVTVDARKKTLTAEKSEPISYAAAYEAYMSAFSWYRHRVVAEFVRSWRFTDHGGR